MGGANSKSQEKDLCVQLHNAIVGGNENVARELLLCGAVSPNNKLFINSRKLVLPLFTAIENNCLSLVEVLLQYDASTLAFNNEGQTPLHVAVAQNLTDVAETLLRHQADPSVLNSQGETALHNAASYGLVNMASLLLRFGALVNCRSKQQRTPLHSACAIPGNTNMIMALLNDGADPDALDEERRASLHYLAQLGNTQGIDILIQAGANKNITDSNGKSSLHVAVKSLEVQATRTLLRHQCDINCQDNTGQTPLHEAVEKEYIELVTLLLQSGADVNLSTSSGLQPLRVAVWKKNTDIVQKLLLSGGARINACDRAGITALHVACLYALKDNDEDTDLVEMLLNSGADVNVQCTKSGRTPLHNAVEAKNEKTVMLLLRKGADPTIVDAKGKSPVSLSTTQSISALLSDSSTAFVRESLGGDRSSGLSRQMDISLNRSTGTIRSTNLYTPPTVRSNIFNQNQVNGNLVNGVNLPPPLPPRDTFAPFSGLEPASLNPPGSATTSLLLPATNVIRHNFTWSSLENDSQTSTHNKSTSSKIKVDVASSSKLLSFPTTFGVEKSGPQTMCCSISRGGQLINTKLGCLLNIEPSSVGSSLLLYVEAINQSNGFLRLPPSCRLCSNIIHFYTHYHDVIRGHGSFSPEVQPEKDVPHFNRQLVVEFPLRKSALNLHDKQENTLKILVSYDEGLTWEETNSYIEKVAFEKSSHPNDAAHVIYTETDELGMYAVVLSPHHDVKAVSSSNNKIVSSASPAVTVSVDLSHNENATIEIMAELVKPKIIEKLQNQDFPYLVDCSRKLSLHLLNQEYQENRSNSVTIHLPCNLPHNTSHTDISYRILKKSEEPVAGGWCATRKGIWEDVTQKECLNLQVSNKGKRLLGSAHSNSHLVSFNLLIKDAMWTSLIVTAVRSFSQSLTNHLVQVPDKIENLQTASSLSFLVHQKSNRRSHVTCDIVSSKDADNINNIYRDSGSYCGPPPSLPQVVHERDIINICTVGGITFSKRSGETSRKIVFNSALLPFSEQFNIQGTSCTYNSRDNYVGFVEITVSPSSTENDENSAASPKPRSALNSESSVLVMENQTVNERTPSQSSSVQELGKSLLASLPLEIPRKHKSKQIKQTSSSHNTVKSSLSDETLHLVCRGLDKLEFYELAFQLNIPTHRVDEVFAENTESPEAAGMAMLRHWQNEMVVLDQDAVPPLCVALRCIGRENMSQDVAKLCNPFVLEELSGLAPLPEQMQENCET